MQEEIKAFILWSKKLAEKMKKANVLRIIHGKFNGLDIFIFKHDVGLTL